MRLSTSITNLGLIVLHVLIGFLFTFSFIPKIYVQLLVIVAVYHIVKSKNESEQAILWMGYFAAGEVFFRMTGGFFFWEFGKYLSIILAFTALLVEKRQRHTPLIYFIYILLLLIGIAFTDIPFGESYRKSIAFNLSGPVQLGIVAIYCYRRIMDYNMIIKSMFYWILPVISMCSFLFLRTPSFEEIVFNAASNFQTTGGFGPNQVSTAIGFGIFVLTILLLSKQKISGYRVIDYFILFYFIFRGLLTFSRGGMAVSLLCLMTFALLYFSIQRNAILYIFRMVLFGFVIIGGVFAYSSDLTSGMLSNRYLNKNTQGVEKEDLFTGRGEIFEAQLDAVYSNPIFGIGVGSGKYYRAEELNISIVSHSELSRLMEEHGLIGIIILIILLVVPIRLIYEQSIFYWFLPIPFLMFWFLTISHSGMRIALPGFCYGLSLIILYGIQKDSLSRK